MNSAAHRFTAVLLAAVASLAASAGASAAAKLRIAYLEADSMLPAKVALAEGRFAKAGLEVELIAVQGGPAAVAAVASGDADIGFAAAVPPINAHIRGVPVKLFIELGQEAAPPDKRFSWLIASKASGVSSINAIKGKKIAWNANGGLCELAWRDHLAAAGIKLSEVKPVALPFPQQEAALEQGGIDATCVINPFYASIHGNAKIGAVDLAAGVLADLSRPVINDGLFAKDDWLKTHPAEVKALAQTLDATRQSLLSDRARLEAAAVKYLDLTAADAKAFNLPIVNLSLAVDPSEVQRLLDVMISTGMQKGPLKADDFIARIDD